MLYFLVVAQARIIPNVQLKSLYPKQQKKIHDLALVNRGLEESENIEALGISHGLGQMGAAFAQKRNPDNFEEVFGFIP